MGNALGSDIKELQQIGNDSPIQFECTSMDPIIIACSGYKHKGC